MSNTSKPQPAIGQVWEDGYGGSYKGRRVQLRASWSLNGGDSTAPDYVWRCEIVAYPARPEKIGTSTYLSNKTLRSKWLFIGDAT
jgi:hypothetical protein